MLSKNAETIPSKKVVCQVAAGNDSTGMSDAAITRHNKKILPFTALRASFHGVEIKKLATINTAQTPTAGNPIQRLVMMAAIKINTMTAIFEKFIFRFFFGSFLM